MADRLAGSGARVGASNSLPDLPELLRTALPWLHDPGRLQRHGLATLLPPSLTATGPSARRGATLRQELLQCIEALRPTSPVGFDLAARKHRLLVLRYVDGLAPPQVADGLAISQRQYFYDLRMALDDLAAELRGRWEPPADAGAAELGAHQPRLTTPLTRFVGRQPLLAAVLDALSSARLLTLTGPPGTGKTRLALEVADVLAAGTGQRRQFPDGVFRVSLANLSDASLVLPTVAHALGASEATYLSTPDALIRQVGSQRVLLLLDNFEQLLPAAPDVVALLQACPHLVVLATSRSPLRVRGERELAVPPLSLPEASSVELRELMASEAVQLFLARARDHNAGFVLANHDRVAVADICRRLDGLPLAIELAAARTRVLSLDQIAARLDHPLDLLGRPSIDLPAHQGGLRAAMDWSWDLLSGEERMLLSRLSVFAGGCDFDAVRTVCGFADPTDLLDSLVERSLLQAAEARPDSGAGPRLPARLRYRLLDTVRQYSFERLESAGQAAAFRDAHVRWCLHLADWGPREWFHPAYLATLEQEHDNLRAALRWCVQSGAAQAGFRLLRMALGLWYMRGYSAECRAWFDELAALPDGQLRTAERAAALATAGEIAYAQGDFLRGRTYAEESLAICQEEADEAGMALAMNVLGNVTYGLGGLDQARELYSRARAVNRRLGLAVWDLLGAYALARTWLLEHQSERARQLVWEALPAARTLDVPWMEARLLRTLGRSAAEDGDEGSARAFCSQALRVQQAIGDSQGQSQTLIALADLAAERADPGQASTLYASALRLAHQSGNLRETMLALEGLACECRGRQLRRGVRLAAAADELRRAAAGVPWPDERARLMSWWQDARGQLGSRACAETEAEGRAMAMGDAIQLALNGRRARP